MYLRNYHAMATGFLRAQQANEAFKACTQPGISISYLNTYTGFDQQSLACLRVTKPGQDEKVISVTQGDIRHICEKVSLDADSHFAMITAQTQISEHTTQLAAERKRAFEQSLVGRAIAWVSGPK